MERPEPAPDTLRTASVVRALTTAGALCYAAWLLFLFRQIERVIRVTEQPFAGQWDQRIEVLGFISLPPNGLVLAPAVAAAATATWIAGPAQELDLAIVLRLSRWSANLLALIAIVSTVNAIVNDSDTPTRVGDIAMRIGGLLLALAMSVVCRAAGRTAPGG